MARLFGGVLVGYTDPARWQSGRLQFGRLLAKRPALPGPDLTRTHAHTHTRHVRSLGTDVCLCV